MHQQIVPVKCSVGLHQGHGCTGTERAPRICLPLSRLMRTNNAPSKASPEAIRPLVNEVCGLRWLTG